MSVDRTDVAHTLTHAMRASLARAELAAGQLARDGATPRARRLASTVSDAVLEVDRLVGDLVKLLVREARTPHRADLRPVLAELHARNAGPLAARGIEWIAAEAGAPPLFGDPSLARRAAALLVRTAASAAPAGGTLALDGSMDEAGWSLAARIDAQGDTAEASPAALAELRALAARARAGFEHERSEGAAALRLHFPHEGEPCRAS